MTEAGRKGCLKGKNKGKTSWCLFFLLYSEYGLQPQGAATRDGTASVTLGWKQTHLYQEKVALLAGVMVIFPILDLCPGYLKVFGNS